jgi:hypothetical protein
LIANLEKAGDQIVWREEEKEITAKEFAHRLRQPGIAIPGDIARKFTFTDPQLAEFDRLAASNDGGTDRKPARQEQ